MLIDFLKGTSSLFTEADKDTLVTNFWNMNRKSYPESRISNPSFELLLLNYTALDSKKLN